MYKIYAYFAKYILGKELVWIEGDKRRGVLTGQYRNETRKIKFYTDFHSEENWGRN